LEPKNLRGTSMLRLILLALLLAVATPALAQRPSTLNMTCSEAARLVASRGAIVLSTGRFTYDRFVSHGGYCPLGLIADPAWERTIDHPECPIGYRCKTDDRFRRR
jgi:hypothetical protein